MARKAGQLISRGFAHLAGSSFSWSRSGNRNPEIPQQNRSRLIPRSTKLLERKTARTRDRASPPCGGDQSQSIPGSVAHYGSEAEAAAEELDRLRSAIAASYTPSPRDKAARCNRPVRHPEHLCSNV